MNFHGQVSSKRDYTNAMLATLKLTGFLILVTTAKADLFRLAKFHCGKFFEV
jgi:hypothetical protein